MRSNLFRKSLALIITILFSLTSLSSVLAVSSLLNGSEYKIDESYITNPNDQSQTSVKKLSSSYQTIVELPEIQQFIAEHFDMVFIARSLNEEAYNIKTLNPSIRLIGYYDILAMHEYYSDWDTVNQHEDWFMRDEDGNRFKHAGWKWYGMDITSGWRDYYANECKEFLDANPHFEGIMADDAWKDFNCNAWHPPALIEDACSSSTSPPDISENWPNKMINMLQHTKNTIGDKILIPNSGSAEQAPISNTFFWENFVHSPYSPLDFQGYSDAYTMVAIDKFKEMSEEGYLCVAVSGTRMPDYPTTEEYQQSHDWFMYCFCCFLFAIDNFENNYFGWNFITTDDGSKGYYPEMDYDFGQPLGEYYQIIDTVYARDFKNAKVIANTGSDNSYEIEIDGNEYTLGEKSGLIISKEIESPDKPSKPLGPISGNAGVMYTYTASTIDPNEDQLYYLFDWGDGTDTDWIGPYNSGETVEAKHTWNAKGSYEVKVKAKDIYGHESEWSDSLPVSMPENKLFNSLIFRLFERFFDILSF